MSMTPDPAREDLAALLRGVADGRVEAFEQLYDATSARVYGLVTRTVRDPRLAEDVVQEVYLQVWQRAADYDPERGSAPAWLLTVAHRRAMDRVRREESAGRSARASAAVHAGPPPDPAEQVAESDLLTRESVAVRRCLGDLTGTQRESIALAYYDGLTYRQVATRLDVALPTVKSRIRDGLRRLRTCLGVLVEG